MTATATPTRSNNLDFLRLAGALLVIVGHGFELTGRGGSVPWVLGVPVQTLGVIIFFAISGYLITASWERTPRIVPYVTARALRIFPGLLAVVLLTVAVIGPSVTALEPQAYATNPLTWEYLANLRLEPVYSLPGVFAQVSYPGAVNGSLWTLPVEFFCYLVVPLALVGPRRARPVALAVFLVLSLWVSTAPPAESLVLYGTPVAPAAAMCAFFAAGALLRIAHQYRSRLFRADLAVAAVGVHLGVVALRPDDVHWISWATLPYTVLTVGLASTPYLRRTARFGDFSFGLYLWSFPTQQLVVLTLGAVPMALDLPLVTVTALALAVASWHVVEKPSLRLKDRLVRRAGAAPRESRASASYA